MIATFSIFPGRIKFSQILLFFFLTISIGCSKDENELEEPKNSFYKDALTAANQDLLAGTWAIFEVGYEGQTTEVPANYEECGRDFFQFLNNGNYKEHIIISSYECEKQILNLNWELEKGIISMQNAIGQANEMVILQLNEEKLVFKMEMDLDEDGEMDVLTFVARHYTPPNDLDLYSYSFGFENNTRDKIKLTWLTYEGFYGFDKYEVYRSNKGCSKANAQLIATIKDQSNNFYIDENPPAEEEICYYFKIYNEKGLIGESEMSTFFTENLNPAEVEFINVGVLNNEVEMEWQPYQGKYFSHYEITVRNYESGTGSGYQEYSVKIIEDKEVTTFLDKNPPHLKNPVYAIYAHDIFGNISSSFSAESNSWELNWTHPAVLDFDFLDFVSMDQDKPEIFLYGRENGYEYNLIKYNYQNNEISATANKLPDLSTSINMRLYWGENGQELFFPQGNTLDVYDADDLTYKYELLPENLPGYDDFVYLGNNIFCFTTSKTIYTYKRTNANLEFIDKKDHFNTHFGSGNYHLIPLKEKEILVGHFQEPQSFKFSISSTGKISNKQLVNIPVKSRWQKKTLYSPEKDYIVNLQENRLYSTKSFSLQESFEKPYYPSGISRNGNLILGSNNDPDDYHGNESIHERKAQLYNLTTGKVTSVESKGYPHLLFENHLGQIISISSGFYRQSLDKTTPKPDIFVEVIQ